ncbi:MAG: PIN domain nuclease [Candidatus Accumulibacter sp.]|jgi:PIN domain nuclease of toxin-antitoxin system|uniref:PIN domain nuclease n=1 Tax=Accumulibacter sp. TaxID=2053492 RepID=UPI001AC86131|nr:PIN domain nuclease [Accumulibacter sp.]MBN8439820.1 PIN domain nuclease [Accumulibacter sp.]
MLRPGLLDKGCCELAIHRKHVLERDALPLIDNDPIDRLLMAQARVEEISLLTDDATVAQYQGSVSGLMSARSEGVGH